MTAGVDVRRIDIGRLVVLPVFIFLLARAIVTIRMSAVQLVPLTAANVGHVARDVLIVSFYVLLIGLYLLRTRARASSRSPVVNTAAVVATFLPFGFSIVAPADRNVLALAAGDLLMLAGLGWSLWALATLGKNISIIPQVRQLVRSGPYAAVRHPLYAGEILTTIGVLVSGFSWPALALFALSASLQVYRAVYEEALLSANFADYADYRSTTARFIPRLV